MIMDINPYIHTGYGNGCFPLSKIGFVSPAVSLRPLRSCPVLREGPTDRNFDPIDCGFLTSALAFVKNLGSEAESLDELVFGIVHA
jgi:hypothetical protein